MSTKKIEFKRLIRKWEYLSEELDDILEMANDANSEFNKKLIDKDDEKYKIPENKEEEDEKPERVEMDKKYKKLFRKIVLKSHPDKQNIDLSEKEKHQLKEIYENTVEAYDRGDPSPLIVYAIKLEINVEEFEEDIEEIRRSCDDMEKYIQNIQSTSAWFYKYMCKTEKEKESFLEKFIELTKNKKLGQ
jgi:hypothetical protein